jgi:8-oxo-dGTP diphosphatase
MKSYVAGLLFDNEGTRVALIEKNRPFWQAGKFNAIGGKIEQGEKPHEAMRREFMEEAGVDIHWSEAMVLRGTGFEISFFRLHNSEALENIESLTDEQIHIFLVKQLPENLVENIDWLVPLMNDRSTELPIVINKIS